MIYSDLKIPHDVKYFDMKLLFIITALCAEVRPKLKEELHGVIYLMEILDVILKESFEDQNVLDTTANKLTLTVCLFYIRIFLISTLLCLCLTKFYQDISM